MNLLRADFGQSLEFRASVLDVILERLAADRLPARLWPLLSVLLTLSSRRRRRAQPRAHGPIKPCGSSASARWALPSFWLGLMLIILFSLRLRLFPVSGFGRSFLDNLWHLFLPALTITHRRGADPDPQSPGRP